MERVIGLMSGTSLDGVDAALLETDGVRIGRFGPALTLPYKAELRRRLRALLDRAAGLAPDDAELAVLTRELTLHHLEAIRALGEEADLIGFHGQTILHDPPRRTWQIGDAALLAEATGLPVVHDFRSKDVAAGGEGAPLVPVFHAALAARLEKPLAVLNIGGVANLTWIGGEDDFWACDTGPGNGPLDDWALRHLGTPADWEGRLARSGRPDPRVLARLLRHPYFERPPPKSLDRLSFSETLATSGLARLDPPTGAATLVAFLAESVACALAFAPAPPLRLLVTGGGRRNPAILEALAARLGIPVAPVETVGWDGDALEAQCFAFLAARARKGLPLTFPSTTGIPLPLPGGRIVFPGRASGSVDASEGNAKMTE
jgi:anhydro-N-acetylmuramic acid kinase